ncbi:MAG TPA: heavy metal-responsive transcriptional regulator [Ilumatobacteraceae bacterium]|nr:heavy metal-responsive transcriptional regulator [Ilumatobacteraceae bacterium]
MRIGEVGEAVGVSTKALRFYESVGLLPEPARTASGYRDYPPEVVERVQFIRDAQAAGLTLAEVTSVLELKDAGHRSCEHTRALVNRHLGDIDERITALRETRARLAELARRAIDLDPVDCTDPQRCQVIARIH